MDASGITWTLRTKPKTIVEEEEDGDEEAYVEEVEPVAPKPKKATKRSEPKKGLPLPVAAQPEPLEEEGPKPERRKGVLKRGGSRRASADTPSPRVPRKTAEARVAFSPRANAGEEAVSPKDRAEDTQRAGGRVHRGQVGGYTEGRWEGTHQ